jgi:hypothetical protein
MPPAAPGPADSSGSEETLGSFRDAKHFAVDPEGDFYVIDYGTSELMKLGSDGRFLTKVGGYGWSNPGFDHPSDIAVPNILDVYVADYGNHRIEKFDRTLNLVSTLPSQDQESPDREFGYPGGVGVSQFGALFIADRENHRIVEYVRNALTATFGGIEQGGGKLHDPGRVRVGTDDKVYIQDGNTVVVFDVYGNYVTTLGGGLFKGLLAITVDQDTLYAMDSTGIYRKPPSGDLAVVRQDGGGGLPPASSAPWVDLAVRRGHMYVLTPGTILDRGQAQEAGSK